MVYSEFCVALCRAFVFSGVIPQFGPATTAKRPKSFFFRTCAKSPVSSLESAFTI
jgi:hypothetical protein